MALRRIRGRNRYCGPAAVSAITGMSTDEAAAYWRRIAASYDQPKFRIRGVFVTEMERCLSEHGYRMQETVVPGDGKHVSTYIAESVANQVYGVHLMLTKAVRARNSHWCVFCSDGSTVTFADSRHRKPCDVPMIIVRDRVLRAYHVEPTEDAIVHKAVERRRWTEAEDAAIREAADWNAFEGLTNRDTGEYKRRLQEVADCINRTYASVRIRASRIGAVSYEIKRQRRVCE